MCAEWERRLRLPLCIGSILEGIRPTSGLDRKFGVPGSVLLKFGSKVPIETHEILRLNRRRAEKRNYQNEVFILEYSLLRFSLFF